MPSTDVSLRSSQERLRHALALVLLAGVLALGFVAIVFVSSFAMPTEAVAQTHNWIAAGYADTYAVEVPVYSEEGNFWVIQQKDGSFTAFRNSDTYWYYRDGRCPLSIVSTTYGSSNEGPVFKARNCTSSEFTFQGKRVYGPSRNLDQYPVQISIANQVIVDAYRWRLIQGKR